MTNKGDQLRLRKVFLLSKLALTIVLACVVVRTVMILRHHGDGFVPSSAGGTENISEPELASQPDDFGRDYSAIVEQNIFGGSGSSAGANEFLQDADSGSSARSTEEELGLVLIGTTCGSPAVARALIKDTKTDKVGLYRTGDVIASAFVEDIESDAVILVHKGKKMTLKLSTRVRPGAKSGQLPSSQSVKKTGETMKAGSPTMQLPNESGDRMGRVEVLLNEAVIVPYAVNDKVEGLRISGLEKVPAAEDLGLKNGDVIRAVNGQLLTSKQHAYQVFKKARTQPSMSIELLRSGRTRQISFALR